MRIQTERLLLRKPRLEDADDLLAYVGDPDVMRWIGGETGNRETTAATIERWLERWEADDIGHFSVICKEHGRVLGRVGFLTTASTQNFDWALDALVRRAYATEPRLGLLPSIVDKAGRARTQLQSDTAVLASDLRRAARTKPRTTSTRKVMAKTPARTNPSSAAARR